MPTRKRIEPGTKIGLKLTAAERKLILDDLMCLDDAYAEVIKDTPADQPVNFTLDDWDGLGGFVAAEAIGAFIDSLRIMKDGEQPNHFGVGSSFLRKTKPILQYSCPMRDTVRAVPRQPIFRQDGLDNGLEVDHGYRAVNG